MMKIDIFWTISVVMGVSNFISSVLFSQRLSPIVPPSYSSNTTQFSHISLVIKVVFVFPNRVLLWTPTY